MCSLERVALAGLFGLSLVIMAGCRPAEVAEPLPVAVRVARLQLEPITQETRFTATVRERHRVELSFKVPGTVAALWQVPGVDGKPRDVQEGDQVTSDPRTPLAQLDDSDYRRRLITAQERVAQAEAKQRAALATVTAVRAGFERIKVLRERDSVAQQAYDDALGKRDAAVAELDAVQREVAAARVALQQADDDFKNCRLVLPLPKAVVSRKYIEKGERVQAGQPVFQIMDLSRVRVAFGVPDTKVDHLQIGQTMTVTADAVPGEQFTGRITKILPAADLRTRTFEVEMTIDEPRGLRPGMVVTIFVGREQSMVLLPLTAIHRGLRPDEYLVYTVVSERGMKVARQRRVKLGGIADNRIQLLPGSESQVGPGDAVVVAGSFRLTEGQPVRVIDVEEPKLRIGI